VAIDGLVARSTPASNCMETAKPEPGHETCRGRNGRGRGPCPPVVEPL